MFSPRSPVLERIAQRSNRYTQNPNAEAIASNYDLLTEILARLPVKSLLRFKSVSKGWYSLISNPAFSRRVFPDEVSGLLLLKNSISTNSVPEFIRLSDKSITSSLSFALINPHHPLGMSILQSCHGLLLCCRILKIFCFRHAFCIYNPTTEQIVALPPAANPYARITTAVSLAFDPTKSPHYKVICVQTPHLGMDFWEDIYQEDPTQVICQIQIYSSQTGSWRFSGNPFKAHDTTQFSGGVFWNGAIHWINESNRDFSLYFKVEEEKLEKMPMPSIPEGWEEKTFLGYFGESRGHLHLSQVYQPHFTHFDIYEMERDYSGWFVKYRVDLDAMTVAFPDMIKPSELNCYPYAVLCVVREANDEDSYMVLRVHGKGIRYNFNHGSFMKICDFEPDDNDDEGISLQAAFKSHVAYQYIPTISSV